MSFYLKYRPQKSSDLDITAVREFYANLLKSGQFSHAYLFSGPRGTGKTSSARILAKIINCEKNIKAIEDEKPLSEPCGKCEMCKRIAAGSSLSVVEMDAASNRGIDDIRALRERIGLAPAEGSHTIYIIDEVHMLTTEAFNALLKTLEEPPKHAVFALCTTEAHKLPETVISRCTRVMFPKATSEEVRRSLSKAIKGEKLTISEKALNLLSESVDGSFRDAIKMLEQLAAGGKKISDKDVEALLHKTSAHDPKPFIDSLLEKDAKSTMAILENLENLGADFGAFAKELLVELRKQLLIEVISSTGKRDDLLALAQSFAEASTQIKDAFVPQLPLEIAAVEWCVGRSHKSGDPSRSSGSSHLAGRSQGDSLGFKSLPKQSKTRSVRSDEPDLKSVSNSSSSPTASKEPARIPKPRPKQESVSKDYPEGELDHEQVVSRWSEVLAGVKPLNHSLEALLRASKPKSTEGSEVLVEVFYAFHKDRLEETKNKSAIEDVMSGLFGSKVRLIFVLGGAKKAPKMVTSDSTPKDDELVKAAEEIFT